MMSSFNQKSRSRRIGSSLLLITPLLLAACGSSSSLQTRSEPTDGSSFSSQTSPPKLPPLINKGRLVTAETYSQSGISLAPPLSTDAASVSIQTAYNDCLSGDALCSQTTSPTIVLARVTDLHSGTATADGGLLPLMDNRLMYVLRFDGDLCVPAGVIPGKPAPTPQPCSVVNFIDASTGAVIYSVQGQHL